MAKVPFQTHSQELISCMANPLSPLTARAQRFPINVPLHYRMNGMTHWLNGTTLNISRSGILFQTDGMIPPRSVLDLQFNLKGMTLSFQGSVVRSMESTAAVKFRRHRLSPASA